VFAHLDDDPFVDLVNVSAGKLVQHRGTRDGGWALRGELLPVAPSAFVLFDLDLDGDLDLVATVNQGEAVPGEGFVLENDGAGNFAVVDEFAPGLEPVSLVVAPLDPGAGFDVAVSNDRMEDNLHVFRSDKGVLGEPDVHDLIFPGRLSAADLDGDADIDLVAGGSLLPGVANLLINDGSGVFAADTLALPDGTIAPGLVAADLDADRAAELVGRGSAPARSFVLRNDGAGSLNDFKQYSGQVVDLNGDGAPDLVNLEYIAGSDESVLVGRLSAP
jgi:hypothetical protein